MSTTKTNNNNLITINDHEVLVSSLAMATTFTKIYYSSEGIIDVVDFFKEARQHAFDAIDKLSVRETRGLLNLIEEAIVGIDSDSLSAEVRMDKDHLWDHVRFLTGSVMPQIFSTDFSCAEAVNFANARNYLLYTADFVELTDHSCKAFEWFLSCFILFFNKLRHVVELPEEEALSYLHRFEGTPRLTD